jgi:signal peptidase I
MKLNQTPPEITPLDRQNVVTIEGRPPSTGRNVLLETLETLALALLLFLAINFVSARIRVDGSSMVPSFHDGDYVIVNRLAYRLGEIERGDVIVFPYPLDPEEDFIKRVIGLPGDRIAVNGGIVYLNGLPVEEDYIEEPMQASYAEVVVPEGYVFVMGDNRNDSDDSRRWGPLSIDAIIGKAVFRYWPLADAGVVDHPLIASLQP